MTNKITSADKKVKTVTDPKVDERVREKLVLARIGLLMKQPFFGNMATRMEIINGDEWCKTAATDGRKFYYNSEYCDKLSNKELEFAFGHEVLHCCYDHIARFGDRMLQLANIAADYCVNGDLVAQNVGQINPNWLYEKKYVGWSFEQVYEDLLKNAEKIDIGELLKKMLDEHLDGDGEGEEGEGKGAPKLTAEEKRAIADEIREAMISASEAVGAGNCPAGVQRMLKDLVEPKMNWRELLQQQIESCVKSDFTWLKPSRRAWHMDAILPGMKNGERITVAIGIDTSGSITDEMVRDFLSEIYGIMGMYEEYSIDIWTFDHSIHNHQTFTSDDGEDIMAYQIKGGGGTSFNANWDYMKSIDLVPKQFVMFTDMLTGDGWGDPDYCPTVFIAHKSTIEAPHGITAKYD